MKGGYGGSRSSPYGGNVRLTQFKGKLRVLTGFRLKPG